MSSKSSVRWRLNLNSALITARFPSEGLSSISAGHESILAHRYESR